MVNFLRRTMDVAIGSKTKTNNAVMQDFLHFHHTIKIDCLTLAGRCFDCNAEKVVDSGRSKASHLITIGGGAKR